MSGPDVAHGIALVGLAISFALSIVGVLRWASR